jgi:hypothetical protein
MIRAVSEGILVKKGEQGSYTIHINASTNALYTDPSMPRLPTMRPSDPTDLKIEDCRSGFLPLSPDRGTAMADDSDHFLN